MYTDSPWPNNSVIPSEKSICRMVISQGIASWGKVEST